jgi:hypothetical protein
MYWFRHSYEKGEQLRFVLYRHGVGVVTSALLLLLHLIAMGLIASHVFTLPDPDQLTKASICYYKRKKSII